MSAQDDLKTAQAGVEATSAALTSLETDLSSTEPTVADNVLAALVTTLEAANYTVTPPAPELPADEISAENTTPTSTET